MIELGEDDLIDGVAAAFWLSAVDMARRLGPERAAELREFHPAAYESARRAEIEAAMMDAGVIPPWFTEPAMCARCGPVVVGPGLEIDIEACAWCPRYDVPRMTHQEFVDAERARRRQYLEDIEKGFPEGGPSIIRTADGFWHRNSNRQSFGSGESPFRAALRDFAKDRKRQEQESRKHANEQRRKNRSRARRDRAVADRHTESAPGEVPEK